MTLLCSTSSLQAVPWYTPGAGSPFFVLTDKQFGPDEEALLRLELPSKLASSEYGGVDVRLYRIQEPLDFLRRQKNLHRIETSANPQPESMANTLSYLWANSWNTSRLAWRDIFEGKIRTSVTAGTPSLKTRFAQPDYRPVTQFAPLPGFVMVREFRYPLQGAENIPVPDAKLQGSSSDFMPKNEGNFYIPVGKLLPGLYLAEAILGAHRAVTLVFVSDTVAVTKLSSGELVTWTANRASGRPVAGAKLQWTDGQGILASGATNDQGLLTLAHTSPERTYILGEDAGGGVFVSENFYYDSEIYATKLYTFTDRPLYRPGDFVSFKCFARTYLSATRSAPVRPGNVEVNIYDPQGSQIWHDQMALVADTGAASVFRLPDNAMAGGYEMRLRYEGDLYTAAFRVTEYVKPHFEITVTPDKPAFKTGEAVGGTIRLAYPGGDPVPSADVDLTLRAQKLTMTAGELRYSGLFPVELTTANLTTDERGEAHFLLPPVTEPSRLILTLLATDGAAYRVRKSSELLVERAKAAWRLISDRKFSKPGETVHLRLEAEQDGASPPASWEIIRLENQKKTTGPFDQTARDWSFALDQAGSYSLTLRDADGNIVAAAAHWASGDGLAVIPGVIEMVTNKERYQAGETAEVLVSFSEPVDEALLTMERDKVEQSALLSQAGEDAAGWVNAERLAPNQWKLRLPIAKAYAPNTTLSAVYVKNGEYVFQNAGIVVETPRIDLNISPSVQVVRPGDTVTVNIDATYQGQPAKAMLTVAVVDEMIYALQAEIAPDIGEFFQHIRRNNVRTGASMNFITYDEAMDYSRYAGRKPPGRHQYNERGVKVLERARRDDTDTAAWLPTLMTDEQGRASFSFKMPDALSRWRITVRAVSLAPPNEQNDLAYGQKTGFIRSDKPIYSKWTSPVWMREGDAPVASLALFNNSDAARQVEVVLWLADQKLRQEVTLPHGVTYLPCTLPPFAGARQARLEVREDDTVVDALDTTLTTISPLWRGEREELVKLDHGEAALNLPADAGDLRLQLFTGGQEHFFRIADSLVAYPWGCVEQTASRLIPLAIAAPLLAPDKAPKGESGRSWQVLGSERLRLIAMAGPKAVFGWWGDGTRGDLLMTAYAYYADRLASAALGLEIPAQHWEHLLDVYRESKDTSFLHRALALWFAGQIGLPVRTQVEGVIASASANVADNKADMMVSPRDSVLLAVPDSPLGLAYARLITAVTAQKAGVHVGADFKAKVDAAAALLATSNLASAKALLLLAGRLPDSAAPGILAEASAATPTLDRALTLVWTRQALRVTGGLSGAQRSQAQPVDGWQPVAAESSFAGSAAKVWRWPDGQPLPTSVRLRDAVVPVTASLHFVATENAESSLPVTMTRTLYRLDVQEKEEGGRSTFTAVPVQPGEALSTRALYLDEINLAALPGAPPSRYGLAEVPLPPGAVIETGTWGVSIALGEDGKNVELLSRSRAQERRGVYGVPIDALNNREVTLRHLLRVSERGHFLVPPARYYRMYQPDAKTYTNGGKAEYWNVE
ncbi:MAG: MG2 domain-containing protein [Desulfobulbus sp.]|nr:MG2 domain-containing protein [Desulfobulbus sp.]